MEQEQIELFNKFVGYALGIPILHDEEFLNEITEKAMTEWPIEFEKKQETKKELVDIIKEFIKSDKVQGRFNYKKELFLIKLFDELSKYYNIYEKTQDEKIPLSRDTFKRTLSTVFETRCDDVFRTDEFKKLYWLVIPRNIDMFGLENSIKTMEYVLKYVVQIHGTTKRRLLDNYYSLHGFETTAKITEKGGNILDAIVASCHDVVEEQIDYQMPGEEQKPEQKIKDSIIGLENRLQWLVEKKLITQDELNSVLDSIKLLTRKQGDNYYESIYMLFHPKIDERAEKAKYVDRINNTDNLCLDPEDEKAPITLKSLEKRYNIYKNEDTKERYIAHLEEIVKTAQHPEAIRDSVRHRLDGDKRLYESYKNVCLIDETRMSYTKREMNRKDNKMLKELHYELIKKSKKEAIKIINHLLSFHTADESSLTIRTALELYDAFCEYRGKDGFRKITKPGDSIFDATIKEIFDRRVKEGRDPELYEHKHRMLRAALSIYGILQEYENDDGYKLNLRQLWKKKKGLTSISFM